MLGDGAERGRGRCRIGTAPTIRTTQVEEAAVRVAQRIVAPAVQRGEALAGAVGAAGAHLLALVDLQTLQPLFDGIDTDAVTPDAQAAVLQRRPGIADEVLADA